MSTPVRITTEQNGIEGYQPWLPQDTGNPRVLAGTNYDFTAAGVRSGFGNCVLATLSQQYDWTPAETFYQHDRAILIRNNEVLTLQCDDNINATQTLFKFNRLQPIHISTLVCYRWTQAYVGETYYYAHPCYGIISFDTFTQLWNQHTPKQLQFSSDIISVASFDNRLFILSTDTVSWSEIDNGLAITPDQFTTAGFQSLNLAHFGTPYGIYSTKFGVYVFTSAGIMHGRATDADNPYNWSTYDTSLPALGPQVITQFKSNILFANANGLQLMGRAANNQFINEQLSPLMSDYLRTEIFPCHCAPHGCDMQLRYSQDREQIFLSLRNNTRLFTHAFVYNIPYEKWSEFNELHETLLYIPDAVKTSSHRYGYIAENAELKRFNTDTNVLTQHNTDEQPLASTVIIGPLTATNEFPDQTFRVTKVQIKNQQHETISMKQQLQKARANDATRRAIHTHDTCYNFPAQQTHYKVCTYGSIGSIDNAITSKELTLQRIQQNTSYYVLNFTASHCNLQITANEIDEYYEIASIVLLGRVAGRI